MAQLLERRTGEGSWVRILVEPLRNFTNSVYLTLPHTMCLLEKTVAETLFKAVGPFYLVSTAGEVKDHTRGKCLSTI